MKFNLYDGRDRAPRLNTLSGRVKSLLYYYFFFVYLNKKKKQILVCIDKRQSNLTNWTRKAVQCIGNKNRTGCRSNEILGNIVLSAVTCEWSVLIVPSRKSREVSVLSIFELKFSQSPIVIRQFFILLIDTYIGKLNKKPKAAIFHPNVNLNETKNTRISFVIDDGLADDVYHKRNFRMWQCLSAIIIIHEF